MHTQIKRIKQYLPGLYKEFLERGQSPKYPLKSLPKFNNKVWGLKEGMTVVAARTSQGKSALSLQFAYDLASQDIPTLFLSLEMTVEALLERLFCNVKEIDNYMLLKGEFGMREETSEKWQEFQEEVKDIPLLITCGIGKTFKEINSLISIMKPPPKAVVIDYIQAISSLRNTREYINEYIRRFRQIALDNKFVGVLCSQINRMASADGKGHYPQLHQLKETGCLEEFADTVLLLHYPYFYTQDPEKENKYIIDIAKQRNGRTGKYECRFIPEYYKFTEKDNVEEIDNIAGIFGGEIQ